MTQAEHNEVVANTLLEVCRALTEVQAPGPYGYWNTQVAERLKQRVEELVKETKRLIL